MEKIIVTGANGYIGRNFIRYALSQNCEVYAIDINHMNSSLKGLNHVHLIECELEYFDQLVEILPAEDYSVFYHFAWDGVASCNKNRTNIYVQIDNIKYACNAALLSKKLNCKKFLTTGSIVEKATKEINNSNDLTESYYYGIAKNCLYEYLKVLCKTNDINYLWATLPNIYGGDNSGTIIAYAILEFMNKRIPTFGPCLQPYNFTYIKDIVRGLLLLGFSDTESGEYILSNGECRQMKDYINELSELFDCEAHIGARQDDGLVYQKEWFRNDKLRSLGFEPEYSFMEGIKDYVKEIRK